MPISHHSPLPQPLCQLAIISIPISHHHAYWPLYQSAICPAFATSKPFRLVFLQNNICLWYFFFHLLFFLLHSLSIIFTVTTTRSSKQDHILLIGWSCPDDACYIIIHKSLDPLVVLAQLGLTPSTLTSLWWGGDTSRRFLSSTKLTMDIYLHPGIPQT